MNVTIDRTNTIEQLLNSTVPRRPSTQPPALPGRARADIPILFVN